MRVGVPVLAAIGVTVALGVAAPGRAAPVEPSATTAATTTTTPTTTAGEPSTVAPATSTTVVEPSAPNQGAESITSSATVGAATRGEPGAVPLVEAPAVAAAQARRGAATQLTPTLPPPRFDLPEGSGTGRRIVYSNSQMRIWAVEEDGTVVKTHRVSGKRYVPSPGTYYVYSRSLHTYSEANPNIRWMYMVRFAYTPNGGRVGFHEIPTKCTPAGCYRMQTEEQLGEPLSGGCVRQSTPDAIWVWNWAPVGTKVVVLP